LRRESFHAREHAVNISRELGAEFASRGQAVPTVQCPLSGFQYQTAGKRATPTWAQRLDFFQRLADQLPDAP
jgi:hypothetical protein